MEVETTAEFNSLPKNFYKYWHEEARKAGLKLLFSKKHGALG